MASSIFLLLIILTVLSHNLYSANGYNDIEATFSVPYGDGYIKVWENAKVKGKYYAMPLVYLRKDSARYVSEIVTDRYQLFFDVVMWTEEANEAVYRYIRRFFNTEIKQADINLLPMEKIRVVWKNPKRPLPANLELQDFWTSNRHAQHQLTFSIICQTKKVCGRLNYVINKSPLSFNDFEIEYIANVSQPVRRKLTITGKCISDTRTVQKLSTTDAVSKEGEFLVPKDLLKQISDEAVAECISSGIIDADYIAGDRIYLRNKLFEYLKRNGDVSINKWHWDIVSWIPKWRRPNILANYLNQILKGDKNNSLKTIPHKDDSDDYFGNQIVKEIRHLIVRNFVNKTGNDLELNDLINILNVENVGVTWTGQKFEPKRLKVYKLNMALIRDLDSVVAGNIRVNIFDKIQSVKLRINEPIENANVTSTSQIVELRLMDLLDGQKRLINDITNDLRKVEILANLTNRNVLKIGKIEFIEGKLQNEGIKCRFEDSRVTENLELQNNLLNLTKDVKNAVKCWKRCYRASEHDYKVTSFHHLCDGKGPTVTLIKVGSHIFGAYTDRNWGIHHRSYYYSTNSFIFEVRKNVRFFPVKKQDNAIYNRNSYGPTFGGGHDLYISERCKYNTDSYSNFGYTYELPSGYSYDNVNTQSYLAGSKNFRCDEVEVYYQD